MKTKFSIAFFLFFFILLGMNNISNAAESPGHVLVARSSSGELYLKTCTSGTTCTDWTKISGIFASEPSLVWDEDLQRYYIYGRNSAGAIWRGSINASGSFNNDWAEVGGSTPSPLGVAGRSTHGFDYTETSNDTNLTDTLTTILSRTIYCPMDGYIVARASGYVYHDGSGASSSFLYLNDSETTNDYFSFSNNHADNASTYDSFSVEKVLSCPSDGGNMTVYFLGKKNPSDATTAIRNPKLVVQYYPIKY